MRAYAKLILPLLCAAACTGAALAYELPDLPEHGAEQPPAVAENQPADTETIEETPEVSDENEENGAIQPTEPTWTDGFLIEPETGTRTVRTHARTGTGNHRADALRHTGEC